LDRWAANAGRYEGATAEKAVPFRASPPVDPSCLARFKPGQSGNPRIVGVHQQRRRASAAAPAKRDRICASCVVARNQAGTSESLGVLGRHNVNLGSPPGRGKYFYMLLLEKRDSLVAVLGAEAFDVASARLACVL
jgi:hypothetical protein